MPFLFFKKYWRSTVGFILILVISTISFSSVLPGVRFKHGDKIVHILMYAGLSLVLAFDYIKDNCFKFKISNWKWYLLIFAVFWGGAIELIQEYLTATRTAEFFDWIADIIGLGLGFLLAIIVNKAVHYFKNNG